MDKDNYPTYRNPSFAGLIGVAQEDITPPAGIYARNWGAANHDAAEGIHSPLMLVCNTFQSSREEKPLILISADLGWWKSSEDEWFVRQGILKILSLEPYQLMICLSHTHAGPSLSRKDKLKPGGEHIEPYLLKLQECAINAIKRALSTAEPRILSWKYGTCSLAANRDLPELNTERIVVGFNPEKEADNALLVGRITDEEGQIIGTIVNYACHPTTLAWDNKLISPDYIGAMRELVETETHAPCLFLQGASGNLAPPEQYVGDVTVAESYGRQVGYAVLATLQSMLPPQMELGFSNVVESGAPLAVWKKSSYNPSAAVSFEMINIEFPLKPLPSLTEIQQQWEECEDRVIKERLWRKLNIRKAVGDAENACVPLWIWRLGDSFLVGQPNEAYSDFQTELRKELTQYAVGVMNVVNGHIGYLPVNELYTHDVYAVWQTPFAQGSLELLIKTAKNSLHQMIKT
ncbi:MAG TPA: neutral/alkaline non-lysosomal ceramidase N-terminal domain-containing protein [Sphingobacteriaceae bacterium]